MKKKKLALLLAAMLTVSSVESAVSVAYGADFSGESVQVETEEDSADTEEELTVEEDGENGDLFQAEESESEGTDLALEESGEEGDFSSEDLAADLTDPEEVAQSEEGITDEENTAVGLVFSDPWYLNEQGEKVAIEQKETEEGVLDLREMSVSEDKKMGFSMDIQASEEAEVTDGELKVQFPENFFGELSLEESNLQIVDGEDNVTEIVPEAGIEGNVLTVSGIQKEALTGDYRIENIQVAGTVNLAELSVKEETEKNLLVDEKTAGKILFAKADIPGGILQNALQDEESGLIAWGIKIGTDTEEKDLTGYTVTDKYDKENLELNYIIDKDGKDLEYEETEDGVKISIPEDTKAPFYYEVYFREKEATPEGETKEYNNHVELSKEGINPCKDAVWSDDCLLTVNGLETLLTWKEFYEQKAVELGDSKDAYAQIYDEYLKYVEEFKQKQADINSGEETQDAVGSSGGTFNNEYLEVAVNSDGRFTMGNIKGDPSYDTDDGKKLLFGHPDPRTSETLIKIDDEEYFFSAQGSVWVSENKAVAIMKIPEKNVTVTETLELVKSGAASYEDAAKISYQIMNNGSSTIQAGVRIMLDTMLANNDEAPFKVPGTGNLTVQKTYQGNNIPEYYQVYDNLTKPTTLATGYLVTQGERKPDTVFFTNWSDIKDSGWNYTPDEGYNLGDSAVAVMFNQKAVAAGNSIDVATRYGVGLGTKGGLVQKRLAIASDKVGFLIEDAKTDDAIKDAEVTVNGNKVTTDDSGMAVFNQKDVTGQAVSIHKEGYNDIAFDAADYEGGRSYTFRIKKVGDDTPVLKKVSMDGVDILRKTASYCEDTSGVLSNSKNANKIKKAVITAEADESGCTYYLLQGNNQIAKNNTGVFELKSMPGSNGDKAYIEKLKAGEEFYIKCVSQSGSKSETQINLKIYSPRFSVKVGKLSKATWSLFKGEDGAVSNLLTQILADGKNSFKLGSDSKYKVTVEVDADTPGVKLGLNMKQDLLKNQTAFNTYFNDAKKYAYNNKNAANAEKLKKALNRWEDSKKSGYRVGTLNVSYSIGGVADLKLVDGHLEGELIITVMPVNVNVSQTTNFWFHAIPMYLTIGGEGNINLQFVGPVRFQEADDIGDIICELLDEFTFYLGGYGEIGAGRDAIAKIGGKLKLGFQEKANFKSRYHKGTLEGSVSLEAKALLWEKSWTLANGTITLYDGYWNKKSRSSVQADTEESQAVAGESADYFEELMSQPTEMVSRDYLDLEDTDAVGTSDDDDKDVTMSRMYTSASPYLTSYNGVQYRFWLNDIQSREAQNRTALVFSYNTGSGWSDPAIVEDDGTADFGYAVTKGPDGLYVAWQDCNREFESTTDMREMGEGLDITMARIKMNGSSPVVNVYSVTKDNVLDQLPAIYSNGSQIYLVWNSMTSTFFEEVTGNKLNYCTFANNTLSSINSVDIDNKNVENIQISMSGSNPTVIYSIADWDDLSTEKSVSTKYLALNTGVSTNTDIKATGSVPQAAKLDGQEMIFWLQDGNICYVPYGTAGQQPQTVFAEDNLPGNLTDSYELVEGNGKTYLLWAGTKDSETEEKNLYATEYENGSWSTAYLMYAFGEGEISNLSAETNADGTITVFWQQVSYDANGKLTASDVKNMVIGNYTELELTDVSYSDESVSPDEDFTVKLTLTNKGNTVIDTVNASVGDTETDFTDLNLQPGQSVEKELVFEVSETGVQKYTVTVSTENDKDTTNNSYEFETGGTELTLTNKGYSFQENNEVMLLEISNITRVPAENVQLAIMADGEEGIVLYNNRIDEIEGLNSYCMAVPTSSFGQYEKAYAYLTTDTEQRAKNDPELLVCTDTTIRSLGNYAFAVSAGEGGTVEGTYEDSYDEESEITLKAVPEDGYVFWKWNAEDGSFNNANEAETVYTMGGSDVNVTAEFRKENPTVSLSIRSTAQVDAGETVQLTAQATPSDTSDHFVWSSLDNEVATVDENGVVTGIKPGKTTIAVTCGSKRATCDITVYSVDIETIELLPRLYVDGIGSTETMDPEIAPANATGEILWTSSDENVAVVDKTGKVTTTGEGSTTITAVSADNTSIKAECEVIVSVKLQGITLSQNSATMEKGKTITLTAGTNPANLVNWPEIEWKVFDDSIAELTTSGDHKEKAEITALKAGETLVEVKAGEFSASCVITVEVPLKSISFSNTTASMKEGEELNLTYTLDPVDTTESIRFTSSNESVAYISSRGGNTCTIYAEGSGQCVISAISEKGKKAECKVTVTRDVVKVSNISELQSPHPYYKNMNRYWEYKVPGAKSCTVTFSQDTYVESGYDYIYLYDGSGNRVGSYTGNSLAGKTVQIPGDTVCIRLQTDYSGQEYGFRVVSVKEHTHSWGAWTTVSKATIYAAEKQSRRCSGCGNTETRTVGSKLKPVLKLNASTVPLQVKQSTAGLKITQIAAGDSVVSWKSSNPKVVKVNNKGKLTAQKKTGKAIITVTLRSGISKKVTVKVQKQKVKTSKITGLKKTLSLKKGKKQTLKPVITPFTSKDKIKYTSSNKKVVSVTSKGVIKAMKPGKAKITIRAGSKKYVITVTVKK